MRWTAKLFFRATLTVLAVIGTYYFYRNFKSSTTPMLSPMHTSILTPMRTSMSTPMRTSKPTPMRTSKPTPMPTSKPTPMPTSKPTSTPNQNSMPPVCGNASDIIDLDAVTPLNRTKVDLFINIPAAGHLNIRRKVLRETWISSVKQYAVAYRFFTDSINIKPEIKMNLEKENEKYNDIVFMPTKQGYWLTHRYLFAMFWGYQHYNFSFYLKVDDDYFVCLNNLFNDLQYRKQEKLLYWGHFGCDPKMVAMDEGFLIISVDLVQEIMKRNNSLCCHPFGGQMIAMWVNRLEHEGYDVTYFPDNPRLMHYRKYLKKEHSEMCKEILGIHQAYPEHMARYWNITKDNWFNISSNEFVKVERKEYSHYCSRPKVWDWRVLNPFWRHEPKPCWEPGLRWPKLEKYGEVQSRELEEKPK